MESMQHENLIRRVLGKIKFVNRPLPVPKELIFPYCDMGDDVLCHFSDEQESFWSQEVEIPKDYLVPLEEGQTSAKLMEVFLDHLFGARVNLAKSDNLVSGHGVILKKQVIWSRGQVLIQGLVGPILNSLMRLERDSSIFNSELVRELFKFTGTVSDEEALVIRYIAVMYNIRDGPYLKILVAALILGDEAFRTWASKPVEERKELFSRVRVDSVEWRLGSQTDWETFVERFYEVVDDTNIELERDSSGWVKSVRKIVGFQL
uniref:Uncharacterized protein n=1 Tax=viral metagenome TaxID=1070528 RepID=A0A2V0RIP6_9ZZZZ